MRSSGFIKAHGHHFDLLKVDIITARITARLDFVSIGPRAGIAAEANPDRGASGRYAQGKAVYIIIAGRANLMRCAVGFLNRNRIIQSTFEICEVGVDL